MKKLLLLFMIGLVACMSSHSATIEETNPPCIDGPSTVTLGQTYSYSSNGNAQCSNCYDWDISGNANISGGDTANTVTINPTAVGTFTLDLTFFNEGGCFTCTKTITVLPDDCEDCVRINITGNQTGTDCTSAYGYLNDCVSLEIESVEWSWALVENCNNPCPLGTVTQIPFDSPVVDLSNLTVQNQQTYPYLQFFAKINYKDKSVCEDFHEELLYCDNMNLGWNGPKLGTKLTLTPNPTNKGTNVSFEGIDAHDIVNISILDLSGNVKKDLVPSAQSFNTNNLVSGIYIVKFTTNTGEIVQKKLVVE
ncbi:MAG: T9SS type A sorting domain-containing protein [Bacteroidota bacterium]